MGSPLLSDAKFRIWNQATLNALVGPRAGETKLGETVQVLANEAGLDALTTSSARYVLIGIPEDIGVRANLGVGGAHTAWMPAVKSLMNIQSTESFSGRELLVLGHFDFGNALEMSLDANLEALRAMVSEIDDLVSPVIEAIVRAGKIPIVIGGGHNNAYPIIKGVSKGLGKSIGAVNMDAHSDFRVCEGRHSGNGFRYAKEEGYLEAYALPALHRNYNSENVVADMLHAERIQVGWFEDIFLKNKYSYSHAIDRALEFLKGKPVGVELDLDCIAGVLSSAATPTGISSIEARQYVHQCATNADVAYLHLCEGATELRDGRKDASAAKLIAYLVSDFVRGANDGSRKGAK